MSRAFACRRRIPKENGGAHRARARLGLVHRALRRQTGGQLAFSQCADCCTLATVSQSRRRPKNNPELRLQNRKLDGAIRILAGKFA